jgi:hypothetical protein
MRHRLVVVAPTAENVVRSAGGWLCDQVMAGWEVVVLTEDDADQRPLRILGVATGSLESALVAPESVLGVEAIAFDAHLCGVDPRVLQLIRLAVDEGPEDVRFWGWGCPLDEMGTPVGQVTHRLSHASKAFKAQALLALPGGADGCAPVEDFALAGVPQPGRRLSTVSA